MDKDLHRLDKKLQESSKKFMNFDGELGEFLGLFNGDLRAFVDSEILKLINSE